MKVNEREQEQNGLEQKEQLQQEKKKENIIILKTTYKYTRRTNNKTISLQQYDRQYFLALSR